MRRRRMNPTPRCYSDLSGVASSRSELRIRNDALPPEFLRGQIGLYTILTMESHPAIGLQAIHRPYQKRTKYRRIYRYLPLLTLSNLFRVKPVDGWRPCEDGTLPLS